MEIVYIDEFEGKSVTFYRDGEVYDLNPLTPHFKNGDNVEINGIDYVVYDTKYKVTQYDTKYIVLITEKTKESIEF